MQAVTAKLMTNISPSYYNFIEEQQNKTQKTKREIVEEALALYMREKKKREILEAYDRMANDEEYQKEMVEMAEMGMEYYLIDIDNADKQV